MAQDPKIAERLARLRAKMANTDLGGGSGFWSPPSGLSTIRILPEVLPGEGGHMEEGIFYQQVGTHYLPGSKDNKGITCPNWTSEGLHQCPICDLVAELWRGDDSDKELARKLRHDRKFWMNVIVRDKDDKGGDTGSGPFIFAAGITIFNAIQTLVNKPDLEYEITDPDYGLDIEIHKKGEKLNTEYQVFPRMMRKDIPIINDDAKFDKFLKDRRDLAWIMLSNNKEEDSDIAGTYGIRLLPYDRMIAEFGIEPGMDVTKIEAQDQQQSSGGRALARDAVRQRTRPAEEEAFPVREVKEDTVGQEISAARARLRGGRAG